MSRPQWSDLSIPFLTCNTVELDDRCFLLNGRQWCDCCCLPSGLLPQNLPPSSLSSSVLQHRSLLFTATFDSQSLVCVAAYLQSVNTSSSSPAIDLLSPLQSSQCAHTNPAFDTTPREQVSPHWKNEHLHGDPVERHASALGLRDSRTTTG